MSRVTLKEFQQLTGLSDTAVLWLLKNDALRCSVDAETHLRIDLDAVSAEDLRNALLARQQEVLDAHADIIAERLGTIVRERLDAVVEDALSRITSRASKGES
jgi:hypothetical protein